MKAKGREGSPQGAGRTWQPSAGVGNDAGKMVGGWGDQPSWPRTQQENSSKNCGAEKTKEEKRSREESQTRRRGKAMEIWEGP